MARTPAAGRRDVPGAVAAIMLEAAAGFGVATADALHGTPIDAATLPHPDTRLALADYERMLANCIARSGEPGFGLHFGSRISVPALGVLGYALMCCRTIRELMEVLARYHRLISGTLHIAVADDGGELTMTLQGGMIEDRILPIDCEIFFAAAAASLRQLAAVEGSAMRVELAYPAPAHGALYRELICAEVRFDAGENRLAIDRRYIDMPLQFANPALLRLYREQCERMLAALARSDEITMRVRHLLLEAPGRFPGFDEVAKRLHMSARTLRRRLDAEGTTYQRIVQELRRQLAETYLADGMLSVAEIAAMLGYEDLSNFRRAFLNWSGMSPAAWRRRARGQGGAIRRR